MTNLDGRCLHYASFSTDWVMLFFFAMLSVICPDSSNTNQLYNGSHRTIKYAHLKMECHHTIQFSQFSRFKFPSECSGKYDCIVQLHNFSGIYPAGTAPENFGGGGSDALSSMGRSIREHEMTRVVKNSPYKKHLDWYVTIGR